MGPLVIKDILNNNMIRVEEIRVKKLGFMWPTEQNLV